MNHQAKLLEQVRRDCEAVKAAMKAAQKADAEYFAAWHEGIAGIQRALAAFEKALDTMSAPDELDG